MKRWTTLDSQALFQVNAWGQGWFRVAESGHLHMCPRAALGLDSASSPGVPHGPTGIDIYSLVQDLSHRGIHTPVLIRFSDLIRGRLEALVRAFRVASEEYQYRGPYRGVYPIKVNQDAHVVKDIVRYSEPYHLGLEAGSKPELQIVLATLTDPEALIICNGYKDRAYIQMALLARKLGLNCIIVVEKADELDHILQVAAELEIQPTIGVRAKLSARGSGRWQSSAGDRAKFGLTVSEIIHLLDRLRAADQLSTLQLLHFHVGSQITNIRAFNSALREATRLYTELHRLGAPMGYLDVGGGLGVDYDGTRTNFDSSMNYDVQEYAHAVVATTAEACDRAGVPHPSLITESGRATVAYSSALIFNVQGASHMVPEGPPECPSLSDDSAVHELWQIYQDVGVHNLQEPLHDAAELREQALTRFNLGLLDLEQRAKLDDLYWHVCAKLVTKAALSETRPEEIEPLRRALASTYYGNFSVFQSAPDSWAIGQMFPIMPIHRLEERPEIRAVLADITCDSDGKIDHFIDHRDVKRVLDLHEPGEAPYYLGIFLVGAYQEILGDLHNLFGDTHAIHVSACPNRAGYSIDHIVEGNTVREVLEYVSYDRKHLLRRLRRKVEQAIEASHITAKEGGLLISTYVQGLESYTYLESS